MGRVGMGHVEECGGADGADVQAGRLHGNLGGEGGADLAVRPEETHFHELMGGEDPLQFVDEGGRHAGLADFKRWIERLAEAAQAGFLGTGELRQFHMKKGAVVQGGPKVSSGSARH